MGKGQGSLGANRIHVNTAGLSTQLDGENKVNTYSWLTKYGYTANHPITRLSPQLLASIQTFLDNPDIPEDRKSALLAKISGLTSNLFEPGVFSGLEEMFSGTSKYQQQFDKIATQIGDYIAEQGLNDYAEDYNSATSQSQQVLNAGQNPDLLGNVEPGSAENPASQSSVPSSSGMDTFNPIDATVQVAGVVSSCFQTVVGMINAVKGLQVSDAQIGLLSQQSDYLSQQGGLVEEQSKLVRSQVANVESSTHKTLSDTAYNFVHRTLDSYDFAQGLADFAKMQSDVDYQDKKVPFSQLPYKEQVRLYLANRAEKSASDLPVSIRKQYVDLVKQFSNMNSDDLQKFVAQTKAETAEGNLRAEQATTLITAYGDGFGKMMIESQKAQLAMNKELFDYQRKLYKQFEEDGMISEESKTRIQNLVAERKSSLLQSHLATLQTRKMDTLIGISDWLDGQPTFIRGIGNWLLPNVSESLDAMMLSFGQSFGSTKGSMVANPLEKLSPVSGLIGGLIK